MIIVAMLLDFQECIFRKEKLFESLKFWKIFRKVKFFILPSARIVISTPKTPVVSATCLRLIHYLFKQPLAFKSCGWKN